jgi:hypothetical protein
VFALYVGPGNSHAGDQEWLIALEHETAGSAGFEWQRGYGAFSIGHAQVEATRSYIADQEAHHAKRDSQAELLAILKKHEIEYDPRYIWS